jgi:hypothetical protein
MGLLVPYIRNADGSIVRVKDGFYIASTKEMAPYLFEEQLHDRPEQGLLGKGIRSMSRDRTLYRRS